MKLFSKINLMTQQLSDTYAILTLAASLLIWRGFIPVIVIFIVLIGSGVLTLRFSKPTQRQLLMVGTILVLILVSGPIPLLLTAIVYFAPKFAAYLYYLSTAGRPTGKIRKIILQRADAIGDTVLATASIVPIKKLYPEAKLDFLCRELTKELVSAHPALNKIIIHPENKGLLIELFKEYDLLISLWEDDLFPLAAWRGIVPHRCGPLETKKYGWLYNAGAFRRLNFARHQVERNSDILQALGAAVNPLELDLHLTPENKKTAEEYLAGIKNDIVALSPGTSGTNKALSAATYARFIELAVKRYGFQFVLLGGKDEVELAKAITSLTGHEVIDLTGRTTVGENAALIARSRFHVGCDSGPTHLAAAVKTPCLVIYTSKAQKPLTWGPWGVPHRIVRKAVDCPLICATRACQATYCADQISAEELLTEFAELVAGRGITGTPETKRYWAAKSLNVLLVGGKEPDGLKQEGFNLFHPERGMIDPLVERDISVIYNPDGKVGFSWRLAALLAGAYLNYPPVIIEGRPTGSFADFFLEKIDA